MAFRMFVNSDKMTFGFAILQAVCVSTLPPHRPHVTAPHTVRASRRVHTHAQDLVFSEALDRREAFGDEAQARVRIRSCSSTRAAPVPALRPCARPFGLRALSLSLVHLCGGLLGVCAPARPSVCARGGIGLIRT